MKRLLPSIGIVAVLFSANGCKPEEATIQEPEQSAQPTPPPMADQVAKTGVGVQGNSLDEIKGNDPRLLIAGPAKAYFNVRERIVFDIQLPQAANLFNALQSRNPKSHEEYMKEIVEANKIALPKLPQGMVYRYRPESNELWVEAEKAN